MEHFYECGSSNRSEAAGAGGLQPVDYWLDRLQLLTVMVLELLQMSEMNRNIE